MYRYVYYVQQNAQNKSNYKNKQVQTYKNNSQRHKLILQLWPRQTIVWKQSVVKWWWDDVNKPDITNKEQIEYSSKAIKVRVHILITILNVVDSLKISHSFTFLSDSTDCAVHFLFTKRNWLVSVIPVRIGIQWLCCLLFLHKNELAHKSHPFWNQNTQ